MIDLFSRHSHKRMGYTWRNDGSSYNPGKLEDISRSRQIGIFTSSFFPISFKNEGKLYFPLFFHGFSDFEVLGFRP